VRLVFISLSTDQVTSVLAQIASFATAVIMMTLLVLSIILMPIAWHFRKTYKKLNALFDRIQGDIAPILHHAHDVVDNLNYITTSVRTDLAKVNETIDLANNRVQHAVLLTERRLNEFNALLSVVQDEAESLFVSTASTVRGVRRGAAAFRERGGMDLASDESDAAEPADDLDLQENGDGYDPSTEPAPPAFPAPGAAVPRVRPRPRSERRA
jgi:uncharacterized protein YoxC